MQWSIVPSYGRLLLRTRRPVHGSDDVSCRAAFFFCTGPLPKALGALSNLTELNLDENQLTGKPVNYVCVRLFVPSTHLDYGFGLLANRLQEPSGIIPWKQGHTQGSAHILKPGWLRSRA